MIDSGYTFYTLQSRMLHLLASIHHRLGEVQARHLQHPEPELERAYRVSAVQATLALEGTMLGTLPVAELVDRPLHTGGQVSLEVLNTHHAMDLLPELDPFTAADLRRAHGTLMHGLALDAGHYRTGPMDVVYGEPEPIRVADAVHLPVQVDELLYLVENDEMPTLITSCVLHFGLVYLRPFTAGNGRMARLWQRQVLMRQWPVFAFLPVEAFIQRTEPAYYAALAYADRQGDCGGFIRYMMERIDEALAELLATPHPRPAANDRIAIFLKEQGGKVFRRQDYMRFFPELSGVSATRDLSQAVNEGRLERRGEKRNANYRMSVVPERNGVPQRA
ncbi:MAG: Fic family protein [Flavobacteriales bacterium]|nr:Fic family protein [Flavobacteriales bacterium]